MSGYILVESRDGISRSEVTGTLNMAGDLCKQGYQVTIFLRRQGVPIDHSSLFCERLRQVSEAGVTVLADEQTLSDRGVTKGAMPLHIKSAQWNMIADHMTDSDIVIWH